VRAGALKKGDAIQTARLAGIMAAKRTASLIPLCHPLPLSAVEVTVGPSRDGYAIEARVRTTAQTGVEMEALTAVSVAALTLYDMVKAVDKTMTITDVELVSKRGGQSGDYRRRPAAASRHRDRLTRINEPA
jgi:cyclic pyranopterin phosphate synthase